jgi:hypothetical protein
MLDALIELNEKISLSADMLYISSKAMPSLYHGSDKKNALGLT